MFDNAISRSLGAYLEFDHYRRLGIDRTRRIARGFNRVKNRSTIKFRRTLHDQHLTDLFQENGPLPDTVVQMRDGWVMDESQSLPHLQELLAESEEIIAERGGVNRGGGDRAHFQQIMNDEHIAKYSSILDFATSNAVLKPVIDYLGFIPSLSVMKPLGVRLNESDIRFANNPDGKYQASQLFHRDYQDLPLVYVIVALREVTLESGPFSLLPASVSQRATEALRYGQKGSPYRVTDEQMYAIVDRNELVEMTVPAGTVLFLDSSNCFHYGSRDAVIPRYLMMYAYVSNERTDFGDLLRKEQPEPVLGDAARLHRAKYPVREGDSRLRRLILDRNCRFAI